MYAVYIHKSSSIMKKSSFCSETVRERFGIPRWKPLWPYVRGACVWAMRMQTQADWGEPQSSTVNWRKRAGAQRARLDVRHGLPLVASSSWGRRQISATHCAVACSLMYCICRQLPSKLWYSTDRGKAGFGSVISPQASCTAQLRKTASRSLYDILAIWPSELGQTDRDRIFKSAQRTYVLLKVISVVPNTSTLALKTSFQQDVIPSTSKYCNAFNLCNEYIIGHCCWRGFHFK